MKKIAVVLQTKPEYGGGHQYAVLLVECLYKNFELAVICNNDFWVHWCRKRRVKYFKWNISSKEIEDLERWYKYYWIIKYYYWYFSDIGKFLRKEKINFIVCAQQGTAIPPLPCKIVYPVHDLMHRYEREFPEVRMEYDARELLYKNVVKNSSIILTDSKLGKRQLMESYKSDMKKRKLRIYVLPFCASLGIYGQEEYIDTPEKYIFYPAQFWQHKNHINLIKAIELLKEKIPNIKLILVGSEKNALGGITAYIQEHNLSKQILIYGYVSNGNVKYLYQHAVMLIMPTYFGPTNIPPLEAMALGCPVAVANKYAMKEQVGKAGLLFSPDSPEEIAACIDSIWNDDELRKRMIKEGYKKADKWNTNSFEERFLKIIRSQI